MNENINITFIPPPPPHTHALVGRYIPPISSQYTTHYSFVNILLKDVSILMDLFNVSAAHHLDFDPRFRPYLTLK